MEVFQQLESEDKDAIEAAKQKLLEQFGNVKDPWLLYGLYDHYLSTNSANTIAILVHIREPHHTYLFDRLSDSITKNSKIDTKVQALTLLGHIVRSQPTWLYKLPEHHLLKDVMKLLKVEVEILPLISALLMLIVLVPIIPNSLGDFLGDIFEIFSRLASWNCNPGRLVEDHVIHMQVALYALFLRLYGMFPCNFLGYLRSQYKDKNKPVFIHTIKPMLETVRMNPSLVTTSKDNETTSERWRKMAVHDIIVECERFSLDVSDTVCVHESCQLASGFRSRSGTTNSALEPSYFQSLKSLGGALGSNDRGEYFTPSMAFNPQTPPMPTYVPQPEFTHDENVVPQAGSSPPEAAIEATPETTPILQDGGQSSPAPPPPQQYNLRSQQQTKVLAAAASTSSSSSQPQSPIRKDLDGGREKSPFNFPAPSPEKTKMKPSSPLKIVRNTDDLSTPKKGSSHYYHQRQEAPTTSQSLKQSDSVLHESEDSTSETMEDDRSSPCTAGGLHMPNSKSIKDFAKNLRRLRHHSQCNPEERTSGSSPEMGGANESGNQVRRANSCPEMKKSPVSSVKDNVSHRTLDETDEEERPESVLSNGYSTYYGHGVSVDTQTDNFWPMPYEHLFLGIFPTLSNSDINTAKSSPGVLMEQFTSSQPSIYEVLDKYVETAVCVDNPERSDAATIANLRQQLKLMHFQLLFERHRREIHAFKNRRFLADAKNTQVLEEHNSALRDQVQLKQSDIDSLRDQLDRTQWKKEAELQQARSQLDGLEIRCRDLETENRCLKDVQRVAEEEFKGLREKFQTLSEAKLKIQASLMDALTEQSIAKEQALAGDKGRVELEFVNKQLLLLGELHLKYKERLEDLSSLRRSDEELEKAKETYNAELRNLQHRLQDKTSKLNACYARVADLEQLLDNKDDLISSQKRVINEMNEDTDRKWKALESKYQTQLTITRSMDEKILELIRQLDPSNKKPIRSPDTSSCQEVHVPSDKVSGGAMALSQRSSPLSCSLASSDGSLALAAQVAENKGLQALVDQESPDEASNNT